MVGGETEAEEDAVEGGGAEEGAGARVDSVYGGIWERKHTMMQKMIPREQSSSRDQIVCPRPLFTAFGCRVAIGCALSGVEKQFLQYQKARLCSPWDHDNLLEKNLGKFGVDVSYIGYKSRDII